MKIVKMMTGYDDDCMIMTGYDSYNINITKYVLQRGLS